MNLSPVSLYSRSHSPQFAGWFGKRGASGTSKAAEAPVSNPFDYPNVKRLSGPYEIGCHTQVRSMDVEGKRCLLAFGDWGQALVPFTTRANNAGLTHIKQWEPVGNNTYLCTFILDGEHFIAMMNNRQSPPTIDVKSLGKPPRRLK